MTRAQKAALARLVIRGAVDAISSYTEERAGSYTPGVPEHEVLKDVSWDDMVTQVATWFQWLPGDEWDNRLPEVWAPKCTHRCTQGRDCGGCGCPGCGYSGGAR